jgi:hypothetical protein
MYRAILIQSVFDEGLKTYHYPEQVKAGFFSHNNP